ncbi:hypothetical protein DPMN_145010 [Dreissena polymorpha]|uniref:Uncharacterized protein n=1 Tax=Dreissena polymorpha TaxID=45954 RepID=A0A9D4F922_DREPO|nr:hypothetical protein DPMN_145010 [Dreissena polymorpha]
MFTGIEASVEDTHSPESIQESDPLMIQQASFDCADHMESTGFTPVILESMSTDATEDKEPASLSHELRQPNPQGIHVIIY